MGTCYYLWREDNKTAYGLNKLWRWGDLLGRPRGTLPSKTAPMILLPQDAPELAELLLAHLVADGDVDPGTSIEFYAFACADIARWSEGMPFEFVDEHDERRWDAIQEAEDRGLDARRARESVETGNIADSWLERGPRCECEEPRIEPMYAPAYCLKCHRYKMCPVCGEHAAAGAIACDRHRHRAAKGAK